MCLNLKVVYCAMRLLSYFDWMLGIVIMVSFTNRNLYLGVFNLGHVRLMDTALESCELSFTQTN